MNKLMHLFFLDFKLLAKDKSFYTKLIIFPAILILVLGTIFNDSFSSGIENFDVVVFNEDKGLANQDDNLVFGDILEDKVFSSVSSMIKVKKVNTYKNGEKLLDDKKAAAFIYIPKDFTENVINDKNSNITLLKNRSESEHSAVVENILNAYSNKLKVILSEKKEIINKIKEKKTITKIQADQLINEVLKSESSKFSVETITSGTAKKPISALQYYSIGMVVMFSMMTAITIIHNVIEEKLNFTYFRIKTLPIKPSEYALGKLMGIIFAILMQMIIVIAISYIVFSMRWGNLLDIFVITLIYSFAIGSIVLNIGFLAKDQTTVSGAGIPLFYILSFLGGSMMSKSEFTSVIKKIQQIIPNGKALNSYIKVCQGGTLKDVAPDLLILFGVGVVFLVISLIIYKGKGGERA